jgi:hypothetical protein
MAPIHLTYLMLGLNLTPPECHAVWMQLPLGMRFFFTTSYLQKEYVQPLICAFPKGLSRIWAQFDDRLCIYFTCDWAILSTFEFHLSERSRYTIKHGDPPEKSIVFRTGKASQEEFLAQLAHSFEWYGVLHLVLRKVQCLDNPFTWGKGITTIALHWERNVISCNRLTGESDEFELAGTQWMHKGHPITREECVARLLEFK